MGITLNVFTNEFQNNYKSSRLKYKLIIRQLTNFNEYENYNMILILL